MINPSRLTPAARALEIGGKPSAGQWWCIPALCCGKDLTHAAMNIANGRVKCFACGDNKALWAAVWRGVMPDTADAPPPREPEYQAPTAKPNTPLPGLTIGHCELYLFSMQTSMGATLNYRNADGREAQHHRYLDAFGEKQIRNPKMTGSGWYPREFGSDIIRTPAVIITEGEKDASRCASVFGMVAFATPGGATRAKDVDWTPAVECANRRGVPIIVCADHDPNGVGMKAQVITITRLLDEDIRHGIRLMPVLVSPLRHSPPDSDQFPDLVAATLAGEYRMPPQDEAPPADNSDAGVDDAMPAGGLADNQVRHRPIDDEMHRCENPRKIQLMRTPRGGTIELLKRCKKCRGCRTNAQWVVNQRLRKGITDASMMTTLRVESAEQMEGVRLAINRMADATGQRFATHITEAGTGPKKKCELLRLGSRVVYDYRGNLCNSHFFDLHIVWQQGVDVAGDSKTTIRSRLLKLAKRRRLLLVMERLDGGDGREPHQVAWPWADFADKRETPWEKRHWTPWASDYVCRAGHADCHGKDCEHGHMMRHGWTRWPIIVAEPITDHRRASAGRNSERSIDELPDDAKAALLAQGWYSDHENTKALMAMPFEPGNTKAAKQWLETARPMSKDTWDEFLAYTEAKTTPRQRRTVSREWQLRWAKELACRYLPPIKLIRDAALAELGLIETRKAHHEVWKLLLRTEQPEAPPEPCTCGGEGDIPCAGCAGAPSPAVCRCDYESSKGMARISWLDRDDTMLAYWLADARAVAAGCPDETTHTTDLDAIEAVIRKQETVTA